MAEHAFRQGPIIAHVARIELVTYMKHPLAVFWTFVYPLILFFLMNAIFGGRAAAPGASLSYSDYLISGLAVLTVVSTALFSFTVPLIELRARSRLKLFATMAMPKSGFFFGFTSSRIAILALYTALFVAGLSRLAPNASQVPVTRVAVLTAFLMASALVLVGLSILLTSVIKRTSTAHAITNVINVPTIFLSDLFLPIALFPPWLRTIAEFSPIYLLVDKFRGIYGGSVAMPEIALWTIALAVTGALLVRFAAGTFSWIPQANG